MTIYLNNKFYIDIVFIESEDRIPSFKTKVECRFYHPTGTINYYATDLWFNYNDWDNVSENIDFEITAKSLKIADLSDFFHINICFKENSIIEFSISIKEFIPDGQFDFNYSIVLNSDYLIELKKFFNDFIRQCGQK